MTDKPNPLADTIRLAGDSPYHTLEVHRDEATKVTKL